MTSINKLIKQYQSLNKQSKKLGGRKQKLQDKWQDLQDAYSKISDNMRDTKIVIDFCIETNLTPTEAKLKYTLKEMQEALDNIRYGYPDNGLRTVHFPSPSGLITATMNSGSGLGTLSAAYAPTSASVSGTTTTITTGGNITLTGNLKTSSSP